LPTPESIVDEALREGEYIEGKADALKWLENREIVVANIYCIGETVGYESYESATRMGVTQKTNEKNC
jgi:hypothetical protein